MKKLIQVIFFISLLFPFCAHTQASDIETALNVKPLKNNIVIKPEETQTKKITIINNTNEEISTAPILEIFSKSDTAGYPDGFKAGDTNNPQDVTNWITIDKNPFKIAAFSSYELKYKITAPNNATPGGHYGAILFDLPSDQNSTAVKVKVTVRIASLLLVNVNVAGKTIEKAQIKSFLLNTAKVLSDNQLVFNLKIKNTGNIHFAPQGKIILKNAKGEVLKNIGKIIDSTTQKEKIFDYIPVNYNQGYVLPQSTREFQDGIWQNPILNEKITAELLLTYSAKKPPLRRVIKFELKQSTNGSIKVKYY